MDKAVMRDLSWVEGGMPSHSVPSQGFFLDNEGCFSLALWGVRVKGVFTKCGL